MIEILHWFWIGLSWMLPIGIVVVLLAWAAEYRPFLIILLLLIGMTTMIGMAIEHKDEQPTYINDKGILK